MSEVRISIKAARINKGINQIDMAKMLNVTAATLSNWENGRTAPDCIQFRRISELTDTPIDILFVPTKSQNMGFEGGD